MTVAGLAAKLVMVGAGIVTGLTVTTAVFVTIAPAEFVTVRV